MTVVRESTLRNPASNILVEAAVRLDRQDHWCLFIAKHSGGGNAKLIDVDLQHHVLHLTDRLRKTSDGGQGLADYRRAAGQNTHEH